MLFISSFGFAQWTTQTGLIYYDGGRVGIGTSNPDNDTKLHIYDASNTTKLRLMNVNTLVKGVFGFDMVLDTLNGFMELNSFSGGRFGVKVNNNEFFSILPDGNIGINTILPTERLDIATGNIAIRQNSGFLKVLTSNAHGVGTWQELILHINNDTISVNGFSPKSLLDYKQTLSISNEQLLISNGNSVDLSNYSQNLFLSNNKLSLSNSNDTINLTTYLDNTDQQQLSIINEQLVISGGNAISLSGLNTNIWEQSNNFAYYNTGKVGIGLNTPKSNLHIHSSGQNIAKGAGASSGGNNGGGGGISPVNPTAKLQLTTPQTGASSTDGLLIQVFETTANIKLQEASNLEFYVNNNSQPKLTINQNGNLKIKDLEGTGERIVTTNAQGILTTVPTNSFGDNLGNHTATENVKMGGYSITNAKSVNIVKDHGNWVTLKTIDNNFWALHNHFNDNKLRFAYNNTNYNVLVLDGNSSNVGIGTNQPNRPLSIRGTGNNNEVISFNDGATDQTKWHINLAAGSNIGLNIAETVNGGNARIFIAEGGNVGVGTNTPDYKLDVNGRLQVRGTDLFLGLDNDGSFNRALVRHGTDKLIINYGNNPTWNSGDYANGVQINGHIFMPSLQNNYTETDHIITRATGGELKKGPLLSEFGGKWEDNTNAYAGIHYTEGNVGIGTQTPNYPLVVSNTQGGYDYANIVSYSNGDGSAFGLFNSQRNWQLINIVSGNVDYFAIRDQTADKERLIIDQNGRVGIGTQPTSKLTVKGKVKIIGNDPPAANPLYLLDVRGAAHFCQAVVLYNGWCDYVFEPDYELMPINELKQFITQNKHLPEIPTEQEIQENDLDLGEMNKLLLLKVEELTLYIIQQNERLEKIEKQQNLTNSKLKTKQYELH